LQFIEKVAFRPARRPTQEYGEDAIGAVVARVLPRIRLAVVYAGSKAASDSVVHTTMNTRSWKSYEAVAHDIAASLARAGCGAVEVLAEDMRLPQALARGGAHLAWLNTGGVQGRASAAHAPSMLEMLGVPYIGHEPLTAATLDNKPVFKRHLQAMGLPTAPFMVVQPGHPPFSAARDLSFRAVFGEASGPFVVKPACGRASQHVHFVGEARQLDDVVAHVIAATGGSAMIEPWLSGREYCVAICGRTVARGGRVVREAKPFIFSVMERALGEGERIFTSMDDRPITESRARLLDPATEGKTLSALKEIAQQVFRAFDLETLVRLDIRADADGRLFVLEANPKPDLKAPGEGVTSLVSIGLAQEGMTYDDLILSLFANRIDRAVSDPTIRHDALMRLIEG